MKEQFNKLITEADTVCVLGHTSPDGDCVGSTLGVFNYIANKYPAKKVQVYLEEPSKKFAYLNGYDQICAENCVDKNYDLCIVCDCADTKRIGKFLKYLSMAKTSFLIDHHMTNEGFCDFYKIIPEASSTCEILYELLEKEFFDKKLAECIYTGLIHDTGVFKYNCTSRQTMSIASDCIEKGVEFGKIIDNSFFSMEFKAKKLLGTVLTNLQSALNGKIVYSVLDRKTMLEAGITNTRDTDGFIDNIRTTDGIIGAIFFYQLADGSYKVSLRSNSDQLNVAVIAANHNGGGHKLAAGGMLEGDIEQGIQQIIGEISDQIGK